jgi:Na+(H+)/acetate symporter ActP
MGYKYIVKTFYWANNTLHATLSEFANERDAMSHSNAVGMAEIIKIYVEDDLIYSANIPAIQSSYA